MGNSVLAELETVTLRQYGPSVPGAKAHDAHVHVERVTKARLTATGHIVVSGECDHAELESLIGSVFLMYGSLSDTTVRAGMNAYVKFATHSDIRAGNDVIVEQSVMRSRVEAGRKIISEADAGKLIGGTAVAGEEIRVHTIGNNTHVETRVEILNPANSLMVRDIFGGTTVVIGRNSHTLENDLVLPGLKRIFVDKGELCVARLYYAKNTPGGNRLRQGEIWRLKDY